MGDITAQIKKGFMRTVKLSTLAKYIDKLPDPKTIAGESHTIIAHDARGKEVPLVFVKAIRPVNGENILGWEYQGPMVVA